MTHRPLSPHIQIYRPQISSVLSILHRGTGIVIAAGAIFIAIWIWSILLGPDCYAFISQLVDSIVGKLIVFAWTVCTAYHLCNGIRHLIWDLGFGFELPQMYFSGKLVLLATVLITAGVWLL